MYLFIIVGFWEGERARDRKCPVLRLIYRNEYWCGTNLVLVVSARFEFLPPVDFVCSMESIDKIGQREKFLAKNYASLDGEDGPGESPGGKTRYTPPPSSSPCWH